MAVPRRREAPLVGSGEVRLVNQDGRYLLVQGVSAVDVTPVLGRVNYPLGQVTLRLRTWQGKAVPLRFADGEQAAVELGEASAEPAGV